MKITRKKTYTTMATMALTALSLTIACGKKKEEEAAAPTEAKMSGTLSLGSALLATTDYHVYCITFSDTPAASKGTMESDGKFNLTVKTGNPFGCFVVKTADHSTYATFVVKGSGTGMGSANTQQISLSKDVDLGALTVSNGKVEIDATVLASAKSDGSSASSKFSDINEKLYKIACIEPTDATDKVGKANYDTCITNMGTDQYVYWQTFEGKKGTDKAYAIAAWASKEAPTACGVNMSTAEYESVKADGYVFDTLKVGSFTAAVDDGQGQNDGGYKGDIKKCTYDSWSYGYAGNKVTADIIHQMHVLTEAKMVPNGFSARSDEEEEHGGGCKTRHNTEFVVTWTTDATLGGAFTSMEERTNCDGKSGTESQSATFNVKFVKQ